MFNILNKSKVNSEMQKMLNAFPQSFKNDVATLLNKIQFKVDIDSSECFAVNLDYEKLEIPYRIYWNVGNTSLVKLKGVELLIFSCLMTRHHDGKIREKYLINLFDCPNDFTSPFIIQLIGEYVIEILNLIYANISMLNSNNIRSFILNNDKYYKTIKSRVISYWDCYYRSEYPLKESYVGNKILKEIDSLIK